MTSPATKPAKTKTNDRNSRRRIFIGGWRLPPSRHGDAARFPGGGFRHGNREDAVPEVGGNRLDVDRFGQCEGAGELAVAALDAVILLAGNVAVGRPRARAADHDARVFGV